MARDPEAVKAYKREYYARPDVRERMLRRQRERLSSDPEFRESRRSKWREWYRTHKRDQRGHEAVARARKRAIIAEFKAGKSCGCGETDPICLDFHHRDPQTKLGNICLMANKCVSDERLIAEIAKCDLICSNCHRKLHRDGGY